MAYWIAAGVVWWVVGAVGIVLGWTYEFDLKVKHLFWCLGMGVSVGPIIWIAYGFGFISFNTALSFDTVLIRKRKGVKQ